MKKVLALALALIMMFAIAIPAMAEGDETEPAATTNTTSKDFTSEETGTVGNTKVEYGVSQSYTVTIPNVVTFASRLDDVEATVSVTNAILAGNEQLVVNVASATQYAIGETTVTKDAWTMVDINGVSTPVDYWVAKTTAKTATDLTDGVVLTVDRADGNEGVDGKNDSQKLYFSTNGTAQEGTYEDRLTFGVEIVINDDLAHEYTPVVAG